MNEIKYKSGSLNWGDYIDLGNGLYKYGCGIFFKKKPFYHENRIWCPNCEQAKIVDNVLTLLSIYANKNKAELKLKDIFEELFVLYQDTDIYKKEDFPELNKVLKVLYPENFRGK